MTASERGSGWHLVDRVDGEAMSLATCSGRKYMMCLQTCVSYEPINSSLDRQVSNEKDTAIDDYNAQLLSFSFVSTRSHAKGSLTGSSKLT